MASPDHRGLVTTRLATMCLRRSGRARGLTFDDHLVRAALVVDLSLLGALQVTDEAVEIDHERAAAHGLAEVAHLVDLGEDSLLDWVDRGAWDFSTWADHLVATGAWAQLPRRPWRPGLAHRPTAPAPPPPDGAPALAVQALGVVAGLVSRPGHRGYGPPPMPEDEVLAGLREHRWTVETVVERLAELRNSMRGLGRAVD